MCSTCSTVVHFSRMRCEPNSRLWCTLTALLVTSPSARTTSPGFTHCSMLLLRGPDLQCWSTRASTRKEPRGQTWATFICRMYSYHSCNNVYTLYVWYIYMHLYILSISQYITIYQLRIIKIRIVSSSSNVIFSRIWKALAVFIEFSRVPKAQTRPNLWHLSSYRISRHGAPALGHCPRQCSNQSWNMLKL